MIILFIEMLLMYQSPKDGGDFIYNQLCFNKNIVLNFGEQNSRLKLVGQFKFKKSRAIVLRAHKKYKGKMGLQLKKYRLQ